MTTGMESPQSSSLTGYYKGFSVLITKRDTEAPIKPLIDSAIVAIDYMIEKGFKPSWNDETSAKALGSTPKKEVVASVGVGTKPCPLPEHNGATMYKKEGKFGPFYSHKIGETPQGRAIYCNGVDKTKPLTVEQYESAQADVVNF